MMQLIRNVSHKNAYKLVTLHFKKNIPNNDFSLSKLTTLSEVSGILTDFTQTSTPAV